MIELTLILGLFLPRLALLIGYLFGGILPNNIPLLIEILMSIISPRILLITYIIINFNSLEGSNWYLTFHLLFLLLEFIITQRKKSK